MLKTSLQMAFKVLLRRKFFTFASLFGISFTLMVLMVVVSALDHRFSPDAPQSNSDRMLFIDRMTIKGPTTESGGSRVSISSAGYRFLDENVRDLPHLERVSLYSDDRRAATYIDGVKHALSIKYTDGAYWQIFDFDFLEGGSFTDQDEKDANPVIVISQKLARKLYGETSALDQTLVADGTTFRVIGVVADTSSFQEATHANGWAPSSTARSQAYRDNFIGGYHAVILAKSSSDRPLIQAELQSRIDQLQVPDEYAWSESVFCYALTLFEELSADQFSDYTGEPRPTKLRLILGVSALLFMLLPSLNIMNLNLSRTLERSSEIGVRRAFGAQRSSLLGQFLVENIVLTLLGGLLGLALAAWVLHLFNTYEIAPGVDFGLNFRVFAWSLALALAFGVLSGLYPAWRLSRLHPVTALRAKLR
ncbi:MAG: ABC transporter permease [Acidobacteriota bacterium]